MLTQLRPALVLVALFTVLTGMAFPLGLVGVGRAVFPHQAGGSLIERDGHVIGSALLGQTFTQDRYFQGRPSATTDTDPADSTKTIPAPYNAGNSGGSNAGPTSKTLIERVTAASAPLAAASTTWYSSVVKSFRRTGSLIASRAACKSARLPAKKS